MVEWLFYLLDFMSHKKTIQVLNSGQKEYDFKKFQ
jgi:hypothetical protein